MLPFLVQLHAVLQSDPVLVALVPPERIGANVRQDVGYPYLEYGITGEDADHSGHRTISFRIDVYSTAGTEVAHEAQEAVEALMTAKNLTPAENADPKFKVLQCRMNDGRSQQRNGGIYVLRREYEAKVADLRNRNNRQKQ